MQEQAQVNFYDFMYGKYLLKENYDITMHVDDYVEKAYEIFRRIGNIASATHAYSEVLQESREIQIPCNAEFIESVTTKEEFNVEGNNQVLTIFNTDGAIVNQNTHLPDLLTSGSTNYIKESQLHPDGQFIPYEIKGKYLYFPEHYVGTEVVIIYRGIVVDDEGNPCINSKQAEAIAARLAFITTQKRAFMSDPAAMNMLSYIKMESERLLQAAAIPEHISQNAWDRLMDIKTSSNRKVFNSSYKAIK